MSTTTTEHAEKPIMLDVIPVRRHAAHGVLLAGLLAGACTETAYEQPKTSSYESKFKICSDHTKRESIAGSTEVKPDREATT